MEKLFKETALIQGIAISAVLAQLTTDHVSFMVGRSVGWLVKWSVKKNYFFLHALRKDEKKVGRSVVVLQSVASVGRISHANISGISNVRGNKKGNNIKLEKWKKETKMERKTGKKKKR